MRTCPPRYGRAPCSSSTFLCPSSTPLRPEAPKGHTEGTCGNEGKEKAQQPLGIAELLSVEAAGIEPAAWHAQRGPGGVSSTVRDNVREAARVGVRAWQ